METCLDGALNDGLYILGRQGGFFFKGQDGSIIDFNINSSPLRTSDEGAEEIYNVTHINDYRISSLIQTEPGYPCLVADAPGSWPENLKGNTCFEHYSHDMSEIISLSFGTYRKVDSKNIYLDVPLCSKEVYFNNSGRKDLICDPSGIPRKDKYSIQNQLEYYIESRLDDCFDEAESYLREQLNATIVNKEDFNVSVFFDEDHTTAKLRFPLALNLTLTGGSANALDYYARADVRFKTIYSFLYGGHTYLYKPSLERFDYNDEGVIDFDINNISYDIEQHSSKFLNEFDVFGISIKRHFDDHGSYIRVIDNESDIGGKPYEYYVRMWNRRPALDYETYNPTGEYDAYVRVGSSLILDPLAFDPDDEGKQGKDLIYTYEVINIGDNWTARKRNSSFYNSTLFLAGTDTSYACVHPLYGLSKNRCTSVMMNSKDVGQHRIKISVFDSGGLVDSQIMDIMVDQDPNLTFEISHIYAPSIITAFSQGYIVSREDIFILNTTGSRYAVIGDNKLVWNDVNYGVSNINLEPSSLENAFKAVYPFSFRPREKIITHPGYENFTSYADYNETFIKLGPKYNKKFRNYDPTNSAVLGYLSTMQSYFRYYNASQKWGYPFGPAGNGPSSLELIYYYNNIIRDKLTKDIYIVECIPYRTDTPSYPYNLVRTAGSDRNIISYYGNHTCCEGDLNIPSTWRHSSSGTSCYSTFENGTYEQFVDSDETAISNEIFEELDSSFDVFNDPYSGNQPVPYNDYDFDLYIREIEGECTGDRGNFCEPKKYNILKVPYCGQYSTSFNAYSLNNTVKETLKDVGVPEQVGYYGGNLCVCEDSATKMLIDTTDPAYKDMFCCMKDNVPYRLSSYLCDPPDCQKVISATPATHCMCEDTLIEKAAYLGKCCCKENGIVFSVADCADCP